MIEQAQWIWTDKESLNRYHQTAVFRREFDLPAFAAAELDITADTVYRLRVNGEWLNDGPARGWPEHYRFDRLSLTGHLREGRNVLEITVCYFGCGTFHQLPLQAGLLAELRVRTTTGEEWTMRTDSSWQVAPLRARRSNVPKNSVQRGPFEEYDGRIAPGPFRPAVAVPCRHSGLVPRESALLTRHEFFLRRFVGAVQVEREWQVFTIGTRELYFPGSSSENHSDALPVLLAFAVDADRDVTVRFATGNLCCVLNGVPVEGNTLSLRAGRNLLWCSQPASFHFKDVTLAAAPVPGVHWGNPFDASGRVAVLTAPELAALIPDIPHPPRNEAGRTHQQQAGEWRDRLFAQTTPEALLEAAEGHIHFLNADEYFRDAAHWSFQNRVPSPLPPGTVETPENMLYPGGAPTVISPLPDGDVELCFDLGEQNCGYWDFAVEAAAGTVIDIAAVEYITPDGEIQHTGTWYHNGLRYICRDGYQRFTSLERRSGRYLFVTVRGAGSPTRFDYLRLIESTYPVVPEGTFHCSDARLEKIWEISERTLKLCMEDTFTDCPLYEQTLWVGDARSEALFAFGNFGAYDLARRCMQLTAESLERFPITGCQVPSGWQCLLPAWSFMWGLSVDDYREETGDLAFVRTLWPSVKKNLDGALAWLDPATGLMRQPLWNLFDWSRTDATQETLLYNSMFLVGALDAALRCAEAIGVDAEECTVYRRARRELAAAIDRAYDPVRGTWPDYRDGTGWSQDAAVHTSMLAVLFDLTHAENAEQVRQNVLEPSPDLIPVSSPFAALYAYQAMEKLGAGPQILEAIYRDYLPMLEEGATTVWETFPGALPTMAPFPTRSHCHGWSAAPLYFLPRLVLGLRMTRPGGAAFAVSPLTDVLHYASGTRRTVRGPVTVSWSKKGDELLIEVSGPADTELYYEPNPTHASYRVNFRRRG